jgi:hypothetical protein
MAIEIVHLATKNGEFQQTMSVYQRVKDRFEELLENFRSGVFEVDSPPFLLRSFNRCFTTQPVGSKF